MKSKPPSILTRKSQPPRVGFKSWDDLKKKAKPFYDFSVVTVLIAAAYIFLDGVHQIVDRFVTPSSFGDWLWFIEKIAFLIIVLKIKYNDLFER